MTIFNKCARCGKEYDTYLTYAPLASKSKYCQSCKRTKKTKIATCKDCGKEFVSRLAKFCVECRARRRQEYYDSLRKTK